MGVINYKQSTSFAADSHTAKANMGSMDRMLAWMVVVAICKLYH